MQTSRAALGGSCARWQLAQDAVCAGTAWRLPSFAGAWQLVHAGFVAGPGGPCGASGPCARWHELHATGAWGPVFFFSAWHEAHAALGARLLGCASWQLVQAAWPAGAVAASVAWQPAQAGFAAFGVSAP